MAIKVVEIIQFQHKIGHNMAILEIIDFYLFEL